MRTKYKTYLGVAAIAIAVLSAGSPARLSAQQAADPAIQIGNNDLGGVVTGPNGPEVGVWVIAETTDLPTKFAKIVVTDDRGRYVIPDLPKGNYSLWVRGYGLVEILPVSNKRRGSLMSHGCHIAPTGVTFGRRCQEAAPPRPG